MDDRRLEEAHLGGVVPALAEVRVLIYCAWNQAGDLCDLPRVGPEDEWKAGGESGG